MKSFDDIERLVGSSQVTATRATDDRILGDATRAFQGADKTGLRDIVSQKQVRKHLPVKIAAVIVVGVGLFSWLIPGHQDGLTEGLVFAEIQKAIQEQSAVFVRGTRTCTFPGQGTEPNETYMYNVEKWASDAGYIDTTFDPQGNAVLQVCYHFESGTVTLVYHDLYQYYRFHVPESYQERLRTLTLLGILDSLFQSGDHTDLGSDTIEDQEAFAFEVADFQQRLDQTLAPAWMRLFFLNITESKARLWISSDTHLPILMQGDFVLDGCLFSDFEAMQLTEVSDQWRWGANMAGQVLLPEKPAGYQTISIPGE